MRTLCSFIAVLFCVLGFVSPSFAIVAIPPLTAAVTDTTGTLSATEKNTLESNLRQFSATKGSQIAVLIIPTTAPETIEQYAVRVIEQWKLGRKQIDDSVLIVVAKEDHRVRIEVGYGLEGVVPDVIAKRIINEIVTPEFKAGNFYKGIESGVSALIALINKEQLPAPTSERSVNFSGSVSETLLMMIVVGGALLRSILGSFIGAIATGIITFFVLQFFVSSLFAGVLAIVAFVVVLFFNAGSGRGYYTTGGPFRGGFGGLGGFGNGGGGFSGGGGSSGGGGASGSW